MTDDWREELIKKMAESLDRAYWAKECRSLYEWEQEARAALAVAEPVIREQCAEAAAAIAKEHLTDTVASIVAAAIREGGKSD